MTRQLRIRRTRDTTSEECTLTRPFLIPPEIIAEQNQQSSTLLKLPPELLMLVITHANSIDAVLLGLTCKRLLSLIHSCHLQVPDPPAHRASWHREASNSSAHACRCTHLTDLLKRFRPKDPHGRASRAWTLCVDCAKYRPTRRAYWSSVLATTNTQRWGKLEGELWLSAVTWFSAGVKLQCPPCRLSEADIEDEIID